MSFIREHLPIGTDFKLLIAWGVVAVFFVGGPTWLHEPIDPVVAALSFAVIFATILLAAFGVVHEADYLAHRLGEPYGTLILTLSIVLIEVILIAAVLLGPGENPTIGRDSIFAVMMIILNLIMGICLILGGRRFGEQEYNAQGALAYVSMTLLLAGIGLILPNTLSTGNGTFWPGQAVAFAALTIILYAAFLLMQTRGHKRYFIQPDVGQLQVPLAPMVASLLVALVMSAVLFPILVSAGALTILPAAVTGLIVGLGFLFCPTLVNNMFQQRSFTLTVIDGLHWTFALVIEAVVIVLLA